LAEGTRQIVERRVALFRALQYWLSSLIEGEGFSSAREKVRQLADKRALDQLPVRGV
jgi:hypothetical protein